MPRIRTSTRPTCLGHEFGPATVEVALAYFAYGKITGPSSQVFVEPLPAHAHLIVQVQPAGNYSAAGLGAGLPVVHVVLLKVARRAEAAHRGQAQRVLDLLGCSLVHECKR